MTTIRRLIQTSPAKANDLFAGLAETSVNALKTRERLFSELKEELELQMRLEEQHLFPVLRKRKETKDLVPDALNDNKETRKALTELERTPKESEAFASKVAELRKAFQQHVRDERKELLPAVLKALDDEEAGAIVEKFEGAKAEVEAAKRTEAEERRAAAREEREKAEAVARQERERVETVRQAAESVGNVVRVSTDAPRRVAETARDAVQSGVGTAAQMAQKATDFGLSSFSDVTRRVQSAAAGMTAVAQANTGLAMRYQAIWREVFQLAQQAAQERTESLTRLLSVRSPQQLLDVNIDLIQREAQRFFDGQARLSQLSAEAALDAKQRIEEATSALKQGGDTAQDKGRQPRRAA
jgi:hemerythrin HHE cation binding domain-containing protein/phasin protein